ncbi:penicillin-binding transpeptidase domain-containing protein, partial [Thermodesulfobacteriota bacterium]
GSQKGYCDTRAIASFAGFAPVGNPRITVLVIIDEPRHMKYGGEIAAPAFSRMTNTILNYLQVAPDQPAQKASDPWQETKRTTSGAKKLG